MPDEFTTMREIGKQFGVSSHVIGRWLVEIGLRTQDKEPSREALAGGYCTRRAMDRGPGSLVVWHVPGRSPPWNGPVTAKLLARQR